ncbi:MAG: family 43 glycosylhydrolase [Kiritimatiellae bacterium]|nr:family 43 glycosylhydrolase [Kiritimatiellia bacterium]
MSAPTERRRPRQNKGLTLGFLERLSSLTARATLAGALLCPAVAPGADPPPVRPPAAAPPRFSDESRRGRPFAKDPSVVRLGDRYLMYFSLPPWSSNLAPPNATRGWSIGIAESRDLMTWRKIAELMPQQQCERNGICAPGARVIGERVVLLYQTYGNGPRDAICLATSTDGITFERHPDNPVFRPTGAWTSGRAIDGELVLFRRRLWMFFATRDPSMTTQMIGVASADPASNLGPSAWRLERDGPILAPELPWERCCVEAPSVVERGGRLWMFYAGGYNNEPQQIGVAVSDDGRQWSRWSKQPLLRNGSPGDWNASESGHPGFFEDRDGRSYLFFQGNNDRGHSWWISWVAVEWGAQGPRIVDMNARAAESSISGRLW